MRRMSYKDKFFSRDSLIGAINFLFKALPMYILASVIKRIKVDNDIWLISERPFEAKDNGYHLFKYIRENHKTINCFYVIDKASIDLPKLLLYGNVIPFYSYKHYLYYYISSKHITTHGSGYGMMPDVFACRLLERIFKMKTKKVYLKHGILYNNIQALYKERTGVDLFICGAKPEYEFVKKEFGYNENEVKYLGLARFDSLIEPYVSEEQIMIMFTWRRWLVRLDDTEFIESEYYKRIDSLLNSKKLNNLIKRKNFKVKFCLHPRFQKFRHLFTSYNSKITILNAEDTDIHRLLKSSKLLITDYSSIFFDFSYIKKPVLYYHFDYKEFKTNQYNEGYFNYEKNGFGPVINEEDTLIKELEEYVRNNYANKAEYNQRINEFFPLRDNKNCQRNYQQIVNLK